MMSVIYVNNLGNASHNLDEVVEKCLFFDYCGNFKIQPNEKICGGKEEDYTKCGTWLHYMEQDAERERVSGGDF